MQLASQSLLLDIETTGLKRDQDQIISIGLTYLDDSGERTTTHLFLEQPDEEAILLAQFLAFIKNYDAIYSYYGKGFEFPFILARLEHYQLDTALFLRMKLIDLKDVLKHFGKNRMQVEPLFDFIRHSQSTGYDIVKLYQTYLASRVSIYKTCILEHQKEELHSTLLFWELYMTLYECQEWQLIESSRKEDRMQLAIKRPNPFLTSFKGTASHFNFSYIKDTCVLYIDIPLYTGSLNHGLEPVKDYYYIESQRQLLHKSLAQFIPADLKRKATKGECVVSKESTFLEMVTAYKMTATLWHHPNGSIYIELTDFSSDILGIQLFNFFFQTQKK